MQLAYARCPRVYAGVLQPPLAQDVDKDAEESAMLVLSRQRDESIIIGDNVVITVVDVRGDKVKLGIEAPREISVHRREVYEAILKENRQATLLKPDDAHLLGPNGAPADRV
jgi:carbon storage regulator